MKKEAKRILNCSQSICGGLIVAKKPPNYASPINVECYVYTELNRTFFCVCVCRIVDSIRMVYIYVGTRMQCCTHHVNVCIYWRCDYRYFEWCSHSATLIKLLIDSPGYHFWYKTTGKFNMLNCILDNDGIVIG